MHAHIYVEYFMAEVMRARYGITSSVIKFLLSLQGVVHRLENEKRNLEVNFSYRERLYAPRLSVIFLQPRDAMTNRDQYLTILLLSTYTKKHYKTFLYGLITLSNIDAFSRFISHYTIMYSSIFTHIIQFITSS